MNETARRKSPIASRRAGIRAFKLGLNPNSSSLGVDVTFLLAGAAAVSILTPFLGALVRLRGTKRREPKKS